MQFSRDVVVENRRESYRIGFPNIYRLLNVTDLPRATARNDRHRNALSGIGPDLTFRR